MAKEDDTLRSNIVFVGTRNSKLLKAASDSHPEFEINLLPSITGLKNRLDWVTADLILIEYVPEIEDPASLVNFIQRLSGAPIIVLGPVDKIQAGIVALRNGAYNFLLEPFSETELAEAIVEALRMRVLWHDIHDTQSAKLTSMGNLIGSAPCMQVLYQTIQNVSKTDATVFIQGASGTGKELVASAIHDHSSRSQFPFVAVNCGAIPPNLLESELFGHEKGSFTGASKRHHGKFEQANHGSLFLDEITELPLELQVKLLRIIQDQRIVRVGGKEIIPVNVRIICATNRDLREEVKTGRFREDLYYRLNVVPVKTPALTERRKDIPLLLSHFLNIFSEKYNKYFYEFTPGAMKRLCSYDWPGNVREMENMIERIVVLNDGASVEERFLPDEVVNTPVLPNLTAEDLQNATPGSLAVRGKALPLWQVEKEMIITALTETHGDVIAASKILELGQATLYRKLKTFGINKAAFK